MQCGCCWTFATTGITECINAMYTGEVVSVSEQQLIDCDTAKPYEDAGCEGGDFTGVCNILFCCSLTFQRLPGCFRALPSLYVQFVCS